MGRRAGASISPLRDARCSAALLLPPKFRAVVDLCGAGGDACEKSFAMTDADADADADAARGRGGCFKRQGATWHGRGRAGREKDARQVTSRLSIP